MLKITEHQLEAAICTDPTILFPDNDTEVVARQLVLPHGILDLLIQVGSNLYVIELKAGKLKEQDIGQVLRYTFDIQGCITYAACKAMFEALHNSAPKTLTEEIFWQIFVESTGINGEYYNSIVIPMLIGSSIDSNVFAAAVAGNIRIRTWNFDNDNFFFEKKLTSCRPIIKSKLFESLIPRIVSCVLEIAKEEAGNKIETTFVNATKKASLKRE